MPSAAALRLQIENALAARIPGALTPRPRIVRELSATGVPELDAILEGGLPIGAISELVGPQSSGRTTLAFAVLAEMTQVGKTVAWIDTSDALDPESAAAAGVNLSRQLWVRCGQDPQSARSESALQGAPSFYKGATFLREGNGVPASSGGCGSPHPRGEVRGLPEAVDAFLHPEVFSRPAPPRDPAISRRNRAVGTPGAPNRKLLDRTPQDARPLTRRARDREEQIPSDRQPSRRQTLQMQRYSAAQEKHLSAAQIANTADAARSRPQAGAWTDNRTNAAGRCLATPPNAIAAGLPRFHEIKARAQSRSCASPIPVTMDSKEIKRDPGLSLAGDPPKAQGSAAGTLWRALDQALRAADLLLAAGGFSAIVLDLGNVPPEFAWRIPLATWFRFRTAAERARTVLMVLTQHLCARSSAELVLRLSPVEPQSLFTVLTGARFRVSVDRRRFGNPEHSPASQPLPVQPNKLHLVSARKQPQREREAAWDRATAWTGMTPKEPQRGSL